MPNASGIIVFIFVGYLALIIQVLIYNVSCTVCARLFVSGDEFLLIDMRLYCRACHEVELEHSSQELKLDIADTSGCATIFIILLWSGINNFGKKSRKSISLPRIRSKKQTEDNPVRGFYEIHWTKNMKQK